MIDVDDFFSFVEEKYSARIVDVIEVSPEPFSLVPYEFNPEVKKRLLQLGIDRLFEHQVQALEHLKKGKNVCVVSATASGKTLIYLLPIIDHFLREPESTFLLVYPTKSLAQDQLKNILKVLPEARPAVYDGDTPSDIRKHIRRFSKIIATNPDMLHYGILPNHKLWANFLRNLKLIVVDEAHVYRGAFGSNAAFVFRRLLRLAEFYGGKPQIVTTSATIGNPQEMPLKLFGQNFSVIASSKLAPVSKKFVFWNPPFDPASGRRLSSNRDVINLFADAINFGLRTIVFSRSKQTAEMIACYAKEKLDFELRERVAVYRAGYTASKRREIEKKLLDGELIGVSTTPALELGIDIGDLKVAIINRFPGTIASFFQQAGRVGRKERSIVFYVAGEDPLDQYYVFNSRELMSKPKEEAVIDLTNKIIASRHLLSAAFEYPLALDDIRKYFDPENEDVLGELLNLGRMILRQGRFFVAPGKKKPHDSVSLRTASADFYSITDADSGEVIGSIEGPLAFIYLHPGAVYLHEMETYIAESLDLENRIIAVKKADDIDYYTVALEEIQINVMKTRKQKHFALFDIYFGEVEVTNQVIGFNRKKMFTEEMLGFTPLDLPPYIFRTAALWFTLDTDVIRKLELHSEEVAGGIHGIEHAHIALLPLYAGCDRWDVGGMSTLIHPDTEKTTIFVFDGYEGGIGFAERGFEVFEQQIYHTLETIKQCPCVAGCPGCIVSPKCGNNNEPLDKKAAIELLKSHIKRAV